MDTELVTVLVEKPGVAHTTVGPLVAALVETLYTTLLAVLDTKFDEKLDDTVVGALVKTIDETLFVATLVSTLAATPLAAILVVLLNAKLVTELVRIEDENLEVAMVAVDKLFEALGSKLDEIPVATMVAVLNLTLANESVSVLVATLAAALGTKLLSKVVDTLVGALVRSIVETFLVAANIATPVSVDTLVGALDSRLGETLLFTTPVVVLDTELVNKIVDELFGTVAVTLVFALGTTLVMLVKLLDPLLATLDVAFAVEKVRTSLDETIDFFDVTASVLVELIAKVAVGAIFEEEDTTDRVDTATIELDTSGVLLTTAEEEVRNVGVTVGVERIEDEIIIVLVTVGVTPIVPLSIGVI